MLQLTSCFLTWSWQYFENPYRKRGCFDSCACASSSRLVQHLSSAESAGARSMDPLRITHRAVLSGTDGFLTDCCKDISTEKQWPRGSLRVFNVEERGASDSWRVLHFFFSPPAPTRKLLFFLDLFLFLKGYHLLHLHIFRLFTICGFLFGTMGDSVFLDRHNSYLVSTRFIGHK